MVVMMMPPTMPNGVCPPAMQMAMHPQMLGAGSPQAMGQKVVMMPMPAMQQAMQQGMQQVPRMVPETVGPAVMQPCYPMDPNQCAARQPGSPTAYAPTQQYAAESSPSFRDVCSPTYQSSEAYERYVKDIMNAEGDDFQFDWPRRPQNHHQGEYMMAEKTRLPESEVSTDEGAWSYASEASNSGRWYNSPQLIMSP
jgi:hypothetical protein